MTNLLSAKAIFASVTLFTVLLFIAFTPLAFAHDGEDHSDNITISADMSEGEMQELLTEALRRLVVLLQKRIEEMHEGGHGEELKVWVELHSNLTHVHIKEPGKAEDTFMLEDLHYTEEEAIIAEIAERTGLSEHDIELVIAFPSGEVDEHGDSHDSESGEEHAGYTADEIAGMHIMANGDIMLGSGEEVHGASITSDGKIKLEDGTLVTPAFDLR
jgi:hypothetical protein